MPSRAARRLRAAGWRSPNSPFGGAVRSRAPGCASAARSRAWRPHIVLTWMSRATLLCPAGDFVHVARLGGYYDLKYYRALRSFDRQYPRHRRVRRGRGLAARAGRYICRISCRNPVVSSANLGHAPGRRALALGRLHPEQGLRFAARSDRANAGDRIADCRGRPVTVRARTAAARLGIADRVRFLGWRSDVPALMAQAALLVCPSLREPLGNVVIEAWAAGLPVVATASDGPAALIEDGESGLLVPLPGQPGGGAAALARAIERIRDDPTLAERLVEGGRKAYAARLYRGGRRRLAIANFSTGHVADVRHRRHHEPRRRRSAVGAAAGDGRGPAPPRPRRRRPLPLGRCRAWCRRGSPSSIWRPATSRSTNPAGRRSIGNGEIYNYIELRAALTGERGVVFSTHSDCELPLHLYRRHGLDFTLHLRGMYALALHDPGAGRLVLARDPFGIKPLYYAETADGFAFASEPGALIDAGLVAAGICCRPRATNSCRCSSPPAARPSSPASTASCRARPSSSARDGSSSAAAGAALPEDGPLPISEDEALAPPRCGADGQRPHSPAFRRAVTACSCRAASIRPPCWP